MFLSQLSQDQAFTFNADEQATPSIWVVTEKTESSVMLVNVSDNFPQCITMKEAEKDAVTPVKLHLSDLSKDMAFTFNDSRDSASPRTWQVYTKTAGMVFVQNQFFKIDSIPMTEAKKTEVTYKSRMTPLR